MLPTQPVPVLELRLAADARVDLRPELGLELLGRGGEPLERRDAGLAEPIDPAAAHVRATRLRWSSASHCFVQRSSQTQIGQCATGYG